MPRATNPASNASDFELPAALLGPTLRALRLANTALDTLFYDTNMLARELFWRGEIITTDTAHRSSPDNGVSGNPARVDLGALSNPEGSILVVDSKNAPYIARFDRIDDFVDWTKSAGRDVDTITITGVGSSALGSAAFAWNVSVALGQRVAAIVPGYGVADAFSQAIGGWFGLGFHEWLDQAAHKAVAFASPSLARVGHTLLETAPGGGKDASIVQQLESGDPASDVLRALLTHVPAISRLVGHSKGALVIENALQPIDAHIARRLSVTTFGCSIDESVAAGASFTQFLGFFDFLGWLNSWGNLPERRVPAHHSTNTVIPLSMPVAFLAHPQSLPAREKPSPGLLPPPSPKLTGKKKSKVKRRVK